MTVEQLGLAREVLDFLSEQKSKKLVRCQCVKKPDGYWYCEDGHCGVIEITVHSKQDGMSCTEVSE